MSRRNAWLGAVAAALLLFAAVWAVRAGAGSAKNDLFLEARELVTRGDYSLAAPLLEQYLKEHPGGEHASRAGLFLGKARLGLGQHDRAREAWELTRRDYAATLEGHKARYKLALLSMLEGDPETARAAFQAMADQPDGPLAPEAGALAHYLTRQAEQTR